MEPIPQVPGPVCWSFAQTKPTQGTTPLVHEHKHVDQAPQHLCFTPSVSSHLIIIFFIVIHLVLHYFHYVPMQNIKSINTLEKNIYI